MLCFLSRDHYSLLIFLTDILPASLIKIFLKKEYNFMRGVWAAAYMFIKIYKIYKNNSETDLVWFFLLFLYQNKGYMSCFSLSLSPYIYHIYIHTHICRHPYTHMSCFSHIIDMCVWALCTNAFLKRHVSETGLTCR